VLREARVGVRGVAQGAEGYGVGGRRGSKVSILYAHMISKCMNSQTVSPACIATLRVCVCECQTACIAILCLCRGVITAPHGSATH